MMCLCTSLCSERCMFYGRQCRDVVGWLAVGHIIEVWLNGASDAYMDFTADKLL